MYVVVGQTVLTRTNWLALRIPHAVVDIRLYGALLVPYWTALCLANVVLECVGLKVFKGMSGEKRLPPHGCPSVSIRARSVNNSTTTIASMRC